MIPCNINEVVHAWKLFNYIYIYIYILKVIMKSAASWVFLFSYNFIISCSYHIIYFLANRCHLMEQIIYMRLLVHIIHSWRISIQAESIQSSFKLFGFTQSEFKWRINLIKFVQRLMIRFTFSRVQQIIIPIEYD